VQLSASNSLTIANKNKASSKSVTDFFKFNLEEIFGVSDKVQTILKNQTFTASTHTLSPIDKDITQIIADAHAEGLGVKEVGDMINLKFSRLTSWEAERIATTELTSANNLGSYNQYAEDDIDYHQWVSGYDHRVRKTHAELNGVIVKVGNRFSNGLLYPGDKEGSIGEWINCRCTTIPFIVPFGMMVPPGMAQFRESDLIKIDSGDNISDVLEDKPLTAYEILDDPDLLLEKIVKNHPDWDDDKVVTRAMRRINERVKSQDDLIDDLRKTDLSFDVWFKDVRDELPDYLKDDYYQITRAYMRKENPMMAISKDSQKVLAKYMDEHPNTLIESLRDRIGIFRMNHDRNFVGKIKMLETEKNVYMKYADEYIDMVRFKYSKTGSFDDLDEVVNIYIKKDFRDSNGKNMLEKLKETQWDIINLPNSYRKKVKEIRVAPQRYGDFRDGRLRVDGYVYDIDVDNGINRLYLTVHDNSNSLGVSVHEISHIFDKGRSHRVYSNNDFRIAFLKKAESKLSPADYYKFKTVLDNPSTPFSSLFDLISDEGKEKIKKEIFVQNGIGFGIHGDRTYGYHSFRRWLDGNPNFANSPLSEEFAVSSEVAYLNPQNPTLGSDVFDFFTILFR